MCQRAGSNRRRNCGEWPELRLRVLRKRLKEFSGAVWDYLRDFVCGSKGALMSRDDPDDTLQRLEEEIRTSRTQAWDVEEFLARRHRAKIEALTAVERPTWTKRWAAFKELFWGGMGIVGVLATGSAFFFWLLTGSPLPTRPSPEPIQYVLPDGRLTIIPPPKAPALPQPAERDRQE